MKDRIIYIHAALDCINKIEQYTNGYNENQFIDDSKTQDAVIRNLEVLGQAIKDFGIEDLNSDFPDQPWRQIAGMRNIIAHEYLGVDVHLVWQTIESELSTLNKVLKKIVITTEK